MPFANLIYRDPADVPGEHRNHSSLARLFREQARDGQSLRDEEERSDGGTLAWRRD
jgi:hypothetical protein